MDVVGMVYRVQQARMKVFDHVSEWQFSAAAKELYKEALTAERMFWQVYRDWYEFWERDDECKDLVKAAADAYTAWKLLLLSITGGKGSLEPYIMMARERVKYNDGN